MKRVHFYWALTEIRLCDGPELCQCVPAAIPDCVCLFVYWVVTSSLVDVTEVNKAELSRTACRFVLIPAE